MTSNSAYIYDLHNVYKNWLNELALSNDELGIFKTNYFPSDALVKNPVRGDDGLAY